MFCKILAQGRDDVNRPDPDLDSDASGLPLDEIRHFDAILAVRRWLSAAKAVFRTGPQWIIFQSNTEKGKRFTTTTKLNDSKMTSTMGKRVPAIGVTGLARTRFDMEFAKEVFEKAWQNLENSEVRLVGKRELSCDEESRREVIDHLKENDPDCLLILQATFTDAAAVVELVHELELPVIIWSFPEPREGGGLRLNSLCGANLAGHALGRRGVGFQYVHADAKEIEGPAKIMAFARACMSARLLRESRLLAIGQPPKGFDTSLFDSDELKNRFGITVDQFDLESFLKRAADISDDAVIPVRQRLEEEVSNLEEVEQASLNNSLRVHVVLRTLAEQGDYQGMAVRCRPEFFQELDCAACGAMSMMTDDYIPCSCEADLYGAVTSLILQNLGGSPVFLSDLVEIDTYDNTGVFWHCGLAPISMADPDEVPQVTTHSNGGKPFLYQFALKPGRITFARLSQAGGRQQLVYGKGEMIKRPISFSGTSGVVEFDMPAKHVLDQVMSRGLEHHFSVIYGDLEEQLTYFAEIMNIPLVNITC